MVAFEHMTRTAKSFVIAMALLYNKIDVEFAVDAATVEVNAQIEHWDSSNKVTELKRNHYECSWGQPNVFCYKPNCALSLPVT